MRELRVFIDAARRTVAITKTDAERVRELRVLLTEMLARDEFLLDCVEAVTKQMEHAPLSVWKNPPIHKDAELDFVIRTIYWPPHYKNNPHRHSTWTVTGVLFNHLHVATYRWEDAGHSGRLVVEKSFHCNAGKVGYVIPPCIHTVANPTDSTSISVHLFSDIAPYEHDSREQAGTVWYPLPRKGEIVRGAASRALRAHCALLRRFESPRALALLDRTFAIGDAGVKLASVKAMSRMAPAHAGERLAKLAAESEEPIRSELERLSAQLLASVE